MLHEHRRRVAARPEDPDARVELAEALVRERDVDGALEQLERALELVPDHRNARRVLLHTLTKEGRYARAAQTLTRLVTRAPDDAGLRDDLAAFWLSQQRPDDALFQLVKADALAPDAARLPRLIELALDRGHLDRALRAARGAVLEPALRERLALETDPLASPASPIAAGEAFVWGRMRERLRRLALGASPAEVFLAEVARGDARAARRAFVLLPADARTDPRVAWVRAAIAASAGDLDGALAALAAPAEHPDPALRALARSDRGDVRFHAGDLAGAARDYEAARAASPDDPALAEVHGDVLLLLGRDKEALRAYERAVAIEPGGTAALKMTRLRSRARARSVGTISALAWHPAGGAITPVQALWLAGTGTLQLTGRVKRTGEEQAKVVHSYLKSRRDLVSTGLDLHLHYEDTEHEKDGPSAGLALALAALSAGRSLELRPGLAATGELTLTGNVRAVGGLHEKLTAAFLHGLGRVLVPLQNRRDLDGLSRELRASIEIIPVASVDEALTFALPDPSREATP